MNIKNTLIIAAVTGSLASVNAGAAPGDSSSSSRRDTVSGIVKRIMKQPKDGIPSPGIYRSEPYLSIVIVPESVDPAFEHRLGVHRRMDDNVIRPYTHLEPYRPDK